MAQITNFDDLKRLHNWARVAKVGSREWIDFASTMIDSFPALYETAKRMNEESVQLTAPLRAKIEALELAEEGAKDAFGHVVQQKRDLEAECKRLRGLLDAAYADIRRMSQGHNAFSTS